MGGHLIAELRRRDHDVWFSGVAHQADSRYLRCDVGEFRQLERIFEKHKFDCVYHLAAEFGRWNGEDFYETLWKSNVIGNKHMIRLQERHRFRLVFFSSSEVYGDWDGVMTEDVMDQHEIRQLNDYAISKWVGEQQILNSAAAFGTETVRVRLFNFYGPGEPPSVYRSALSRFVHAALLEQPFTVYGDHTRSWFYVRDGVEALANICERFQAGAVYNIAAPESITMKELSDTILRLCGKTDRLVTYKPSEAMTTRHKRVDNSRAVRDIGLTANTSIEEGLRRTIDWMRAAYLKKA